MLVCKDFARLDRPAIREEGSMYPFTLVTVDKVCTIHAARIIVAVADFCCLLWRQKEFNAFFFSICTLLHAAPGRICCVGPQRSNGTLRDRALVMQQTEAENRVI